MDSVLCEGGEDPGGILTKPMTWPGGNLLINADPRRDISGHHTNDTFPGGKTSFEIRDEQNHPLDGFRFTDCNPITNNTRNFEENSSWTRPEKNNLCAPSRKLEIR